MISGLVDNNVEYCLRIDHDELQKLTENETKSNPNHVLTAWLWFCQNLQKLLIPTWKSIDEKSEVVSIELFFPQNIRFCTLESITTV